jgi:hypothetical protein
VSFIIASESASKSHIEWIIEDRVVANDINLIDGRKSAGKSSVASAIIGDWHNDKRLQKENPLQRVLWLGVEENFNAVVKPRLLQYGLDPDQPKTIDYKHGVCPKPILPNDAEQLLTFILKHNVNALVIDPFSELKPGDWSINDGDQMRAYMTCIGGICSRAKCTAFALRHMRKASGTHAGDDGMGSVQIKNSIRQPLRVDVTEEKNKRRFFSVDESNISKPTHPLEFDYQRTPFAYGKLVWKGEFDGSVSDIKKMSESRVKRSKLEEAKRLLLEALREGEKSAKTLIQEAKDYGIGDRTLDDAKADLGIKSVRKVDSTTGNGMWTWRLPTEQEKETNNNTGEPDMQLTLMDLPEQTGRPIETITEDEKHIERLQSLPTSKPGEKTLNDIYNGDEIPKAKKKLKALPKAKPEKKPKGQGGKPKNPPKGKSK